MDFPEFNLRENMLRLIFLASIGIIWKSNAEISDVVIDISHWNPANFTKFKAAGIVAVVHKATEGRNYVDKKYASRRTLAEKEGLLWGAYHFGWKGHPEVQADHFLAIVGNASKVLLMLDVEPNKGNEMTPNDADKFVMRIKEKTGRYPFLYGSSTFLNRFDKENLNKCPLWIAFYAKQKEPTLPNHRTSWTLWQYTNGKGGNLLMSVKGDDLGPLDRNRYNGTTEKLKELWPNIS